MKKLTKAEHNVLIAALRYFGCRYDEVSRMPDVEEILQDGLDDDDENLVSADELAMKLNTDVYID